MFGSVGLGVEKRNYYFLRMDEGQMVRCFFILFYFFCFGSHLSFSFFFFLLFFLVIFFCFWLFLVVFVFGS